MLERLKNAIEILKNQHIIRNQQEFVERIGYNKSSVSLILNGRTPLSKQFVSKVCEVFPMLNSKYLFDGVGEVMRMVKNESLDGVPYWNLYVTAGHSVSEIIGQNKPDGYIQGLPGADIAENILPVAGASMEPEISSSALVGVRKINNWETLNTERIYLIITTEDRMIKRIEHDSEDENILWCVSPNYPKFKIYKSDIIEIQRVCFVYNPK